MAANVIAILQGLGVALLRLSHPKFVKKVMRREQGVEML